MARLLILLALPLLATALPFALPKMPMIGGTIFGGDNDKDNEPDIAANTGVLLKPNFPVIGNVGNAFADTIKNTAGAIPFLAAFGEITGNVVSALSNGARNIGEALGPLNFGLGAEFEVELKNSLSKYFGAVLSGDAAGALAAFGEVVEIVLANGAAGNGTVNLGPAGSVDFAAALKEAINIITGAMAVIAL